MRKYGIPVLLAIAVGIGIGLLIATPRTPATAEAAREFSIAAIPALSEVPAAAGREPGVHAGARPRPALKQGDRSET